MGLVTFTGLRTYSAELRRDLEQLQRAFNDLVQRTAPLFSKEPASKFDQTNNNSGSVTGLASPVAQVHLAPTVGTATTAMRSDAAPRLDVTISPTGSESWKGEHAWSPIANKVPITVNKTAQLTLAHLVNVLDTDDTPLVTIDNDGLVGVNCNADTNALVTVQAAAADTLPVTDGLIGWYKGDNITSSDVSGGLGLNNPMITWPDASAQANTLVAASVTSSGGVGGNKPRYIPSGSAFTCIPCVSFFNTSGSLTDNVSYFSFTNPITLSHSTGWTVMFLSYDFITSIVNNIHLGGDLATDIIYVESKGVPGPALVSFIGESGKHFSNDFNHTDANEYEGIVLRHSGASGVPANTLRCWVYSNTFYPTPTEIPITAPQPSETNLNIKYLGRNTNGATITGMPTRAIAELIIYNRSLTDAEVTTMASYLKQRLLCTWAPPSFDLTHWNSSAAAVQSRIDPSGRFGFGLTTPTSPVHLVSAGTQIQFGNSATNYTGFKATTQAAPLTYTMPTTGGAGILHNSAGNVWSWATVDISTDTNLSVTTPITLTGDSVGIVNQGSTTTVLHGNAAGNAAFSAVSLTADVTGTLPIANGGTANTTANTAFAALSPMTTRGDLITRSATVPVRLGITGTSGMILRSDGTDPAWASLSTAGIVGGSGATNAVARWSSSSTINASILATDDNISYVIVGTPIGSTLGASLTIGGATITDAGGFTAAGGDADTGINPGAINFNAGSSLANKAGAPVTFAGGTGGPTALSGSGAGGYVAFIGGPAVGNNNAGGDIRFRVGTKSGSGRQGQFSFGRQGGSGFVGIFDFESIATSDKTFTFPNTTGTIALTSDIPVGANPTGTIGVAAVNGSATTFLRSDAAPAFDMTIARNWTAGVHTFTAQDVHNAGVSLGTSGILTSGVADAVAAASFTYKPGTALTAGTDRYWHAFQDSTGANTLVCNSDKSWTFGSSTGGAATQGYISVTGNLSQAVGINFAPNNTTSLGTTLAGQASSVTGGVFKNTGASNVQAIGYYFGGVFSTGQGTVGSGSTPTGFYGGAFRAVDAAAANSGKTYTNWGGWRVFAPAVIKNAGTITNYHGGYVENCAALSSGMTITNQYGLYVEEATRGGTLNIGLFLANATAGYKAIAIRDTNTWIGSSAAATLDLQATTVLVTADMKLGTAGNGLYVKEGTNATMGRGQLVGGVLVINTTKVTATSEIFIGDLGGGVLANAGALYEDSAVRVAGTSFTVKSLNPLDTSKFCWMIVEPA